MPVKSRLTFRWAALGVGILLLFYLGLQIFARNQSWYPGLSDGLLLACNLIASIALIYGAFQSRNLSRKIFLGWLLLGMAQLCSAAGDAIFIWLKQPPDISVADIFYLAYYPVFALGILQLPSKPLSRDESQRIALDITIIMLAAGMLLWNFIIAPLTADSGVGVSTLVYISYPALDLVLLFVLVQMAFRRSQDIAPTLILQAGLILTILADVIYALQSQAGVYSSGSMVDWIYACSYCSFALAGVIQAERSFTYHSEPENASIALWFERGLRGMMYMPYIWGWAAFLVVAFHEQLSNLPLSVVITFLGGIFFLIMVRQILSLTENARIYREEQRQRLLAEALANASREMSASLDPQAVPGLILDQLALVVPYERCSIMLEREDHLYIAAQRGFPKGDERTQEVNIAIRNDDPYLDLVKTLKPLIISDVTKAPGWTILPWLPLNKAWMGVPLISRQKVVGMFSITRLNTGAFSQEDAELAAAFASQAVVALDNAQLYGDLHHAYHTLEILDSTKAKFIEVVAHELRTPITVIKGYTQVLSGQSSVQADPQNAPILEGIITGTERMQSVVNNMLDVSKIENQLIQLRKEPTSLANLFRQVILSYSDALAERRLILATNYIENMPMILADGELLHKVFDHLIMNAIKYTPDGGKITISGSLSQDRKMVEIVIADTGIGIDRQELEVIFEKFYQTGEVALHSSGQTKFKGGGSGLGLPIARGIILAHGGSIWAESPGHDEEKLPGSKLHVMLPL